MSTRKAIAQLEAEIDAFYRKHSTKRTAIAAVLTAVVSVTAGGAVFSFVDNWATIAAVSGMASLVSVYMAILWVVPPTSRLEASKEMILDAVREPRRVEVADRNRIRVANANGEKRLLNSAEQTIWNMIITPFFLRAGSAGTNMRTRSANAFAPGLTSAERKILLKEKEELVAKEREIKAEQQKLATERRELELRTRELQKAEDLVIERLSKVEMTEAELEQLRDEVDQRAAAQMVSGDSAQGEELARKERELQAKEAELEQHKRSLEEDRKHLEVQKTDLNQLKGELVREHDAADGASRAMELELREQMLEARMKELETTAADLEERTRYVSGVEDSLIDRLNMLSEREASVEQSEVNAGIRHD